MANVTPTTPVRAFASSSLNTPANFTNRGTGSAGTNSPGVCTVRLGACGSALTGCCACIPATPQPRENNKPTPAHLIVRFMGSPLSSAAEGRNSDFLAGQAVACFYLKGTIHGKPGDDPENYANTTLDFMQSQLKQVLFDSQAAGLSRFSIMHASSTPTSPSSRTS